MSRAVIGAIVCAFLMGAAQKPAAAQGPRDPGTSEVCGRFAVAIINGGIFGGYEFTAPDEGWAYVDPNRKRVQATGIAHTLQVAGEDTPANHYSHDLDFKIRLDPEQDYLLSIQPDNSLAVEWETGVRPWEKFGDGANPIFPKWAWPSPGDRVWVDGNWIHDCGHPDDETERLYTTEIHPARAVASMREAAAPLPGTGLTPVPVTLTNLYISGNGGFTPHQLNCGPDIILGPDGGTCGQNPPPEDTSYQTTPINDTDFGFDVCLPPRPTQNAVVMTRKELGPGNTVHIEPSVEVVDTARVCLGDPGYDQGKMLRVTVPLNGTPTPPTAVYARRIYGGWLVPPDPVLPRRVVTLETTNLREDHDLDPGDGELTFWWMNVDIAQSGWLRLSDFADGNMDDYDDETASGDGEMNYSGASWDFYLRPGQTFTLNSQGYEQDCFDTQFDGFWFTHRRLELVMYVACYADFSDAGAGDKIGRSKGSFTAADLGARTILDSEEYDIRVNISAVPTTLEDMSHLSIQTACTPDGEVALAGHPLTCVTRAHNGGTGLPRQVHVTNRFSGAPMATIDSATWSIPAPLGNGTYGCSFTDTDADCEPDTIPVTIGIPLTATTVVTPAAPGLLTDRAEVTTASNDPDLTNNVATATVDVFKSVTVDVEPDDLANIVEFRRRGLVTVAVLTTDEFDAATIDPGTVCFGDAETPSERACIEVHGQGHLTDVNRDRRRDMVFHFDVEATGIDLGDTQACLKGRTADDIGIYGCDAVAPRQTP